MESALGGTVKKTSGTTGIRRIAGCLALTAALGFIPAFAAGEQPPRTVAPADAASPSEPAKERGTSKPRQAAQAGGENAGAARTAPARTGAGPSEAPRPAAIRGEEARPNMAESPKAESARPEGAKAGSAKTGAAAMQVANADSAKPGMVAPNTIPVEPAAPAAQKIPTARTGMEGDSTGGENNVNVRKYCTNIAPAATDARFAWQSKKLQELDVQIKSRIAELDAKEAELKAWLDRRDKVAKEAREALVGIYSKMKPETAATQITALDDEMATAVLSALTPRQASAIFNEITPPERAAKLAGLLANPLAPPADKKL